MIRVFRIAAVLAWLGCAGEPLSEDRRFGPNRPGPDAAAHPVAIHVPDGLGRLRATLPMAAPGAGREVVVACKTCHGGAAAIATRAQTGNDRFHTNVELAHGTLECLACHDARDRDRLHLADGRPIAFDEVVTLCAQCHGPQYRDYTRGSHGGMNGYWDLRRGPRTRNSCVDCHAPHTPAYRAVIPVFPPRDRYLGVDGAGTEEH